jgi:hypothetical protein
MMVAAITRIHLNRTHLLYYGSLFLVCITDISKPNSKTVGRREYHSSYCLTERHALSTVLQFQMSGTAIDHIASRMSCS